MFFNEFGNELAVQPARAPALDAIPLTVGLAGGGYVVVWQTSDGDIKSDVTARVYDAFGNPQGAAFTVFNDFINVEFPRNVDVIALPNGGFAVASVRILSTDSAGNYATTSDIALQYFTSTGAASSAVISASTTGGSSSTYVSQPELTLAGNKLVVTWDGGEGPGSALNAREFDLSGNAATAILTLDSSASGVTTQSPGIAGFANGGFLEVWRVGSSESASATGSGEIRGQLFAADGTATGASFQINTNSTGIQGIPHVSVLDNGNAIVTWLDYSGATVQIHGQLLSSTGTAIGSEFTLADTHQPSTATVTTTTGTVTYVNDTNINDYGLTALHDGGFAISFRDGADQHIYVREFGTSGTAVRAATSISNTTGNFSSLHALAGGGYEVVWNDNANNVVAQTIAEHRSAVANDFNGDGKSDVLWRNDDGTVTNWLGEANGNFAGNAGNSYNNPGPGWTVAGTGDFNGDGHADILWRNTNGDVTNWLGTATGNFTGNAANSYNNPGAGWTVAGIGDFNGDGHADILWRNTNGDVTNWLGTANGNFAGNAGNSYNNPGAGWTVVGTGDFNGDGRDDVLWRNANGDVTDWLGTTTGNFAGNAANSYNNPGAGWTVVGIGDFNGDGRDDILWRNTNGDITNWLGTANGNFAGNAANSYNNPGAGWTVVGTGDYNGDGRDDVLWRNTNGDVTDWLGQANGNYIGNAANSYNNLGLNWHVQPDHSLFF